MITKRFFALLFAFFLISSSANANDEILFADFEGEDYGTWQVEGTAFGTSPARGTLDGQMGVSGYFGDGLVNSYNGGDPSQGKLTSPEFVVERKFVSFLLGGGGHPGTHIDLIVEGKTERTATGPNTVPGGSEKLDWFSWDVSDLQGRRAILQIVDEETGGWGHINVDQIVFGDRKKSFDPVSREIKIEKRFLHLPIKTGAPATWAKLEIDGKPVREFIIEFAENDSEADFHATLQVEQWKGRTVRLTAERVRPDFKGLDFVTQSDELADQATAYREKYRPQFHFSPRRGWTNDPNGLVFYKGEYHLFFQHNPFGVAWNNMTWGHAVSPDLLHWTELPDAIEPDELGTIFSGSATVDWNNSAGFQQGDEKTLCALFTYNGPSMRYGNPASQGLAYSNDRGRTWIKYEKNPVIPHIVGGNRDPKVFWFEPTRRWMTALYMDGEDYAIFSSENLTDWEKVVDIKNLGCSECPDMFELPIDGDSNRTKWVFWGGNGKYLIGSFDGKNFVRESEPLNMKWGGNDYAAQSYSDTPGRRIQFSWMSGGSYPNMPFNQQFSVPRELTLRSTPDGVRLCSNPVVELETLRGDSTSISNVALTESKSIPIFNDELLDVVLSVAVGDADRIEFRIRGQKIVLLPKEQKILSGDVSAPMAIENGKVDLRILLDRTSIELFVADGLSQIARCFVPEDGESFSKVGFGLSIVLDQTPIELFVADGLLAQIVSCFVLEDGESFDSIDFNVSGSGATLERLDVWKLKSVWNR